MASAAFRPLRNNISVRPLDAPRSTIIIDPKERPANYGEVIAIGPKVSRTDLKPGDRVGFGTLDDYLTYTRINIGPETLLVMSENDVCFVDEAA